MVKGKKHLSFFERKQIEDDLNIGGDAHNGLADAFEPAVMGGAHKTGGSGGSVNDAVKHSLNVGVQLGLRHSAVADRRGHLVVVRDGDHHHFA